ncbi:OsmC family protein [Clostridium coskatii]|uniref:OsmC-like protein n=1 Tax=Clostridium coskatii TaxID=1705578 RepID=A0A166TRB0_9CLOT|nr:OsmC family protein [Clostridium coskatii]OAA93993.1 OsmC-like protein [Clostridium coskatii]OBR90188.1 OsmC-like protein [Clostridium coskatii]
MPFTTVKAVVEKKDGIAVEAHSGGFKVLLDKTKQSGGTNKGMNPAQLLLCTLGGCQAMSIASYADKYGVNIKYLSIELEGDMDSNTSPDSSTSRSGYQDIRFNVNIRTDSSENKVRELVEFVEKTCPMGDSIRNGVPIEPAKISIEKQMHYMV